METLNKMNKPETEATLYVVGNLNVDLIMSTLHQWPEKGTEAMLESSSLRPGGSAGNCALALAALGTPHRLVANQGNDQFTAWLASLFPESAPHWPTANCETSLTFGVTHPDHERTFFSNQGNIVRLNMDDVLLQLPSEAARRLGAAVRHLPLHPSVPAICLTAGGAETARLSGGGGQRLAAAGLERCTASADRALVALLRCAAAQRSGNTGYG